MSTTNVSCDVKKIGGASVSTPPIQQLKNFVKIKILIG